MSTTTDDLSNSAKFQQAELAPDAQWYTEVYQGDQMPQLTWRAIVIGALLGALMSISNLYTTMKIGWNFGVAITSCVLSFVIWNAVRAMT